MGPLGMWMRNEAQSWLTEFAFLRRHQTKMNVDVGQHGLQGRGGRGWEVGGESQLGDRESLCEYYLKLLKVHQMMDCVAVAPSCHSTHLYGLWILCLSEFYFTFYSFLIDAVCSSTSSPVCAWLWLNHTHNMVAAVFHCPFLPLFHKYPYRKIVEMGW